MRNDKCGQSVHVYICIYVWIYGCMYVGDCDKESILDTYQHGILLLGLEMLLSTTTINIRISIAIDRSIMASLFTLQHNKHNQQFNIKRKKKQKQGKTQL